MSFFKLPAYCPAPSRVRIERPKTFEDELRTLLPQGFCLVSTAWNDVSRGSYGGYLSAYGDNITDVTLQHLQNVSGGSGGSGGVDTSKKKAVCTIVAGNNLNPELGVCSSRDIQLIIQHDDKLQTIRLDKYLQEVGQHGNYAGMDEACDLSSSLDDKVSVRFQCAFVQVEPSQAADLCVQCYNYQTGDASDPKNLLVVSTTQGSSVQQDMPGRNLLLLHNPKQLTTHTIKLEETRFAVGQDQIETQDERQAAHQAGKATSGAIGVRSMKQRLNTVVTVQVPLQQRQKSRRSAVLCSSNMSWGVCGAGDGELGACPGSSAPGSKTSKAIHASSLARSFTKSSANTTCAARASIGEQLGRVKLIENKNCARDATEHVTVTIMFYYLCNGVPTKEEVSQACQDLSDQYKALGSGKLSSQKLSFARTDVDIGSVDACW